MCGKEIIKPRVDQLCCDRKECRDVFTSNMIELWKLENPEKIKDNKKKSYEKRIEKDG